MVANLTTPLIGIVSTTAIGRLQLAENSTGRTYDVAFDDVAEHVSTELLPGARGGGRTREQIIRHTILNEPDQFSRKVEVRTPFEVALTADGLAVHRQQYLDAMRAYNADGRPARTWPIQFLIRRSAQHMMDHAWEMEDRDLNGSL